MDIELPDTVATDCLEEWFFAAANLIENRFPTSGYDRMIAAAREAAEQAAVLSMKMSAIHGFLEGDLDWSEAIGELDRAEHWFDSEVDDGND